MHGVDEKPQESSGVSSKHAAAPAPRTEAGDLVRELLDTVITEIEVEGYPGWASDVRKRLAQLERREEER